MWLPELQVPGSRVSLYFVRAENVAYTQESTDPIFPAELAPVGMQDGSPLFINKLRHSTVFACADKFTIRHPKHHIEWRPMHPNNSQLTGAEWKHPDVLNSLHILNVSYLAPTHYASLYSDMSTSFNAPKRIHSIYSSPLDPEQWKLEIRRMANTELALLQSYILGIANGLGHDLPRAVNLLDNLGVDARGKILYVQPGSKNIKVASFVGFVVGCAACWVLTYQMRDPGGEQVLVIVIAGRSILWCCMFLKAKLSNGWNAKAGKRLAHFWKNINNVRFDDINIMLDDLLRR